MSEDQEIQSYGVVRQTVERKGISPSSSPPSESFDMGKMPDLLGYWKVVRKRSLTIFTIAFGLFVVVLLGTLRQTPIYEAKVLLEIQNENSNAMTLQQLFQLDDVSDSYLETQYKILQSTSLAHRVIEQLRLDQIPEFNPPPVLPWLQKSEKDSASEEMIYSGYSEALDVRSEAFQDTLEAFFNRLKIRPVRRSRLVEVSIESEDPELAARVVNALASNYIEQNLEGRWEVVQKASEYLENQLQDLRIRVEKSEETLNQYARENGLLYLEGEGGRIEDLGNQRLRRLQEELTKAQVVRFEKEALFSLFQSGQIDSLPGVADNRLVQNLSETLVDLQRQRAQLLVTFRAGYPKVLELQQQIDELEKVLENERERVVQRLTYEHEVALKRERLLAQAFEAQQLRASLISEKSVQYNILKREADTSNQLYEGLLQRLKEAGVSGGLDASNIRVVDSAVPPDAPIRPKVLLNLALGMVFGLGLGVGAAFLQEHFDNTIKSPEDITRFLSLPALATIPALSLNGSHERRGLLHYGRYLRDRGQMATDEFEKSWFRIDRLDKKQAILAEAFRGLRTSVLLSAAERAPRSILITSSLPGEGKSTVCSNLAISLAQMGRKVLIVDCDMHRPSIHKIFDIQMDQGLVNYFTGQSSWQAVVRQNSAHENLFVLVCGPVPPNPADLIASARIRNLLEEATETYDFVLLDSPPLGSVADARMLAFLVDGTILVVRGARTPWMAVQKAQVYLGDAGAHILGVVLNNLTLHEYGTYGYYSQYGDIYTDGEVRDSS